MRTLPIVDPADRDASARIDAACRQVGFFAVPLDEALRPLRDELIALASEFRQGEALLAGKLVPSPTLGRIGPRWSVEGGSDIASDWAAAR